MAPGVDADAEDREVLRREDQLRNKKEKKNKKGDSSKPKPKSKSRKGKGKKKTTSALDKPTAKPGAKARKLLRSAKKKKQDSEEGEVGDEGTAATAAPTAKAKAKSKAATSPKGGKAKAKPGCKKPAASDNVEPPKKRIRRKTSQWEDDDKLYDQELYEAIQDYVYKFTTEDAGNQFKKKVKYLLKFQMLRCTIDPYYSRQSCITKAPKDITADGKDTSWCFSFYADSEKDGLYWQFEMACAIMCAHLMVPRLKA